MLKKSPFYDFLNRNQDRDFESFIATSTEDEDYINWNGRLMPMDYGDAEFEYRAIRDACAVCDVSPMQKIMVRGSDAGKFFDHLSTRPVSHLPSMQATYIVFCHENGSLMDDAVIYKYAEDEYFLLPSDIDHTPYFQSICDKYGLHNVSFEQCAADWAGMAIQGPKSAAVALAMGFDDAENMKPFEIRNYALNGTTVHLARVGYTADLGYECWVRTEDAYDIEARLEAAREITNLPVPGYGLTALQVCRIEGGFIVAGWDCASTLEPDPDFERTPLELGLSWLVKPGDAEFRGREALLEQKENGTRFTFRSFRLSENVQPAERSIVTDADGEKIGEITCAFWSWGLDCTIGHVSLRSEFAAAGHGLVEVDGHQCEIEIVKPPLLTPEFRNTVPAPLD